jgi:hypothetical protein
VEVGAVAGKQGGIAAGGRAVRGFRGGRGGIAPWEGVVGRFAEGFAGER